MRTYAIIALSLAAVWLFDITNAAPEYGLDDSKYVRIRRGSKKAEDAGMTEESKPTISAQTFTTFLSDQIKEKIKKHYNDEVIGDIEPIALSTKDFPKEGKPEDFDITWGMNYFLKIKANTKSGKKEAEKFYHIRIFKGTHPDDYPRLVGIFVDKKKSRSAKDEIEPFGMFEEFQPDPMDLPVIKE